MDAGAKRDLLDFLGTHGAGVVKAAGTAWNLREYLKECKENPSLRPVLNSLLPRIRADLELTLIESHLADLVSGLPDTDGLSVSSLIALAEELRFPGSASLRCPPGVLWSLTASGEIGHVNENQSRSVNSFARPSSAPTYRGTA